MSKHIFTFCLQVLSMITGQMEASSQYKPTSSFTSYPNKIGLFAPRAAKMEEKKIKVSNNFNLANGWKVKNGFMKKRQLTIPLNKANISPAENLMLNSNDKSKSKSAVISEGQAKRLNQVAKEIMNKNFGQNSRNRLNLFKKNFQSVLQKNKVQPESQDKKRELQNTTIHASGQSDTHINGLLEPLPQTPGNEPPQQLVKILKKFHTKPYRTNNKSMIY